MRDVRQGARDQRRVLRDDVGTFGLRMPHQRADADASVRALDAIESFNAVDVDQQRRRGQPHVQRGDQALPAGEQFRLRLARDEAQRLVERTRLLVGERRRLHVSSAFCFAVFWRGSWARATYARHSGAR
jgi:hypothetical protein